MNDSLPTVLALPHDLLSVLQGRTLTVCTKDGGEVRLRLMTADEFEAKLRAYREEDPSAPPIPPRWRIEELTRGLPS